jgi:osmoprotectant transport system substrate-binding protein
MHRTKAICLTVAALALLAGGCRKAKKPIVVGSKSSTEQILLGEIVAQHLEHRLGTKIERRLNLGGTLITYQTLVTGDISLYPEYTGAVAEEILREQPSPDASLLLGRVKGEMQRIAQTTVLDPLGIDNGFVIIVRDEDANKDKLQTITDATQVNDGWKLGVSYEFEQRNDGIAALNQYKLPMSVPVRSMDLGPLFKALEQGELTMIAADATDGPIMGHNWKILQDDKKVFPPYQACLMVRQDALAAEPKLGPALAELSGKFSNEVMRRLNAQIDLDHRQPADVAAAFLTQAGLK